MSVVFRIQKKSIIGDIQDRKISGECFTDIRKEKKCD